MSKRLEVGMTAPDFTALVAGGADEAGDVVTLSKLRGQRVVLYFYPKDDTPGCTTQACALRDGWGEVSALAKLFGVSPDPIKKHLKFQTKHALPIPLISDEEHAIATAYGVWVEKMLYGRKFMGVERTTFVVDEDGKVEAVLAKVRPAEHLGMLIEVLRRSR